MDQIGFFALNYDLKLQQRPMKAFVQTYRYVAKIYFSSIITERTLYILRILKCIFLLTVITYSCDLSKPLFNSIRTYQENFGQQIGQNSDIS